MAKAGILTGKFSIRFLLLLTLVASIYVWIASMPPTDISKVRGIEIKSFNNGKSNFIFTPSASRTTVAQLANLLEQGGYIDFYDSEPTISDPGVYATMKKSGDGFLFHFGNHGWTSSWIPVSNDEAIDYLWACREDNDNVEGRNSWPYMEKGMRFFPRGKIPQPDRISADPTERFAIHIRERDKND